MPKVCAEFSDLLTPRGLRILAGNDPACGALRDPAHPLISLTGVIDKARAEALRLLLERHLRPHLVLMDQPIPRWTIDEMPENYSELLPKTGRVWTAYLGNARARSFCVATELGLVALLRSESLVAFAAALAGRPLLRRGGMQVLCYGQGDYAGPHNDHHPEDAEARAGYVDLHLALPGPGVAHQWLVYERAGHLSEMVSANSLGGVNAYRLPFWHYTTPLLAKRGKEADARRWLLLGTFLDSKPKATTRTAVWPRSHGSDN